MNMGRNRKIPCNICSKIIRGDNMKQHMRSHGVGKVKPSQTKIHQLVSDQSSGVPPSSYGISPQTIRDFGDVSSSVQQTSVFKIRFASAQRILNNYWLEQTLLFDLVLFVRILSDSLMDQSNCSI